ncbi:hypothetical protein ABEF95_016096 [Exophiala dermatitidis]
MEILKAVIFLCTVPILWISTCRTYGLVVNYLEARKFGIPIKIVPFNRQDDIWLHIWRYFYPLFRHLPFNLGSWMDYSYHGWNVHIRFKEHEDLGDCFVLVTPNKNEIVLTDSTAGIELESKYKTWQKPEHHYHIFNIFGKNLLTANGDDWQRHRKIINPAFRERTYHLVWHEALRQAGQMVQLLRARSGGRSYLEEVRDDCVIFAMHVLSAVGFGHQYDFDAGHRRVPLGHKVSFADTIWYIFSDFLRVVMFRNAVSWVPKWLRPRWLQDIELHLNEFRQYSQEAIDQWRKTGSGTGPAPAASGADIINALIHANEVAKDDDRSKLTPAGKRSFLSDTELYGNIFILNLAGFEPVANGLMHVFPFLATHAHVQEWVCEEVDAVLDETDVVEYDRVFPRLLRCKAVVYETLRFWGPLGDTTRICLNEPQLLRVGKHELMIPPGVYVNWDFAGSQTDRRWWGLDSLEWRPQRWIHEDPETGQEVFKAPSPAAEKAFNAWSGGPRVCVGEKFSQVEIVALVATLLRSCRLRPMIVPERGMQNEEDARRELLSVTNDAEMPRRVKSERLRDVGIVFVDR